MNQQTQNLQQIEQQFEILPLLTPEQQAKMQKQYIQRLQHFYGKNKKYEIDYWYQAIKQYTYPSFYFPLTVIQAYLLHCLYYEQELTEQLIQVREKLIEEISRLLKYHTNVVNKGKFFMKLSTRSPKDFCWDYRDQQQFKRAVENLKRFLQNQNITQNSSIEKLNNTLYKFFLINSKERLLIQSGQDFIKIFSKSQRIITDINDFSYLVGRVFEKLRENKLSEEEKDKEIIRVWVRDWDDCTWQQEFRTFYYDYKLTGISQYDQRCYFPGLSSKKQEIAKRCLELFEKVRPQLQSIGLDKGVMDFIIKPNEIKIVEINVCDRDARASLFNWNEDEKILMNGPLEVRVLEKQIEIPTAHLGSIMGMIDKKSIDVITTVLEQTNLLNIWK